MTPFRAVLVLEFERREGRVGGNGKHHLAPVISQMTSASVRSDGGVVLQAVGVDGIHISSVDGVVVQDIDELRYRRRELSKRERNP